MANRRLLISYAHPDDESFGLGALIAKYVEQGVEVYLICATNGDTGTVAPELLNGYKSVAELRLSELDCAAETLKLTEVIKLGYKDSGMMGSETTNDPDCLWQADQAAVTRQVVEVIRRIQPHVVITFNEYGAYGHPDHIAIQRATRAAFPLAGDTDYDTGQLPYQPQKLYYSSIPRSMLRLSILIMRLQGKNPRALGKNADIDMVKVLENVDPATTAVNIRRYYDHWEAASQCHKSQLGGGLNPLPRFLRPIVIPTQGFTRIHPQPPAAVVDEDDLFAGVTADDRTPEATP